LPGLNTSFERLFQRHPLGFPMTLIIGGGAIMSLALVSSKRHGRELLLVVLGAPFVAVGLLVLAFGITTVIKRRTHPIVLTCPKCSAESRTSPLPFNVQRWDDVS